MTDNPTRGMLEKLTARGIRIFQVHGIRDDGSCTCTRGSSCTEAGKHPFGTGWINNATTDMRKVDNWLAHAERLNWGILTGLESKLFVVDIDPRSGGEETWATIVAEHGELPKTMASRTGGGGTHYYMRRYGVDVFSGSGVLGPGVDIKGEHSLVVIPPSQHTSGGLYAWEVGPGEMGPTQTPKWLRELLTERQKEVHGNLPAFDEFFTIGSRDDALFKGIRKMYDQRIPPEVIRAVFVAKLESGEIEQGPGDAVTPEGIDQKIEAVLNYRRRKPLLTGSDVDRLRSHTANAKGFVEKHENDVLYVNGSGWFAWNKWCWGYDPAEQATTRMMIGYMDDLYHDAIGYDNKEDQRKASQWAINSQNSHNLSASLVVASKLDDMAITADDLDDNLWLINFRNGTLDLKTGELQEHDRSDHITKCVPADYDPGAECSTWLKTLDLAFDGNERLIGYLQRALGYSLSGDTSEQCMFICWGEDGNNGKSTILEGFHRAVGRDYSNMTDPVIITTEAKSLYALSSMAMLRGTRIVNMTEAAEGQYLNEAMVKQITGGDHIPAKFLHKDPFNFLPQFKVWMRTNSRPNVRGTEEAIWRRIKLIPFVQPIPEKLRKPRHVVDMMLDLEREGILAWAVEGCQMWQDQGLDDPDEVVDATTQYRTDMDIISQFLGETTTQDKTSKVPSTDLYRAYDRWCKENGFRGIMTSNRFSRRLKRLGLESEVVGGNKRVWVGVVLTDEWVRKSENIWEV